MKKNKVNLMNLNFKSVESYKHLLAKKIVSNWILLNPALIGLKKAIKVKIEDKHCALGSIIFVPDLTVYSEKGVQVFIEIFHKHELNDYKIERIERYCKSHKWDNCYILEIDAEWVMSQIKQPGKLKIKQCIILN